MDTRLLGRIPLDEATREGGDRARRPHSTRPRPSGRLSQRSPRPCSIPTPETPRRTETREREKES